MRFRVGNFVKHKMHGDTGVVLSEDNMGRIIIAWTRPTLSLSASHPNHIKHVPVPSDISTAR